MSSLPIPFFPPFLLRIETISYDSYCKSFSFIGIPFSKVSLTISGLSGASFGELVI